MLRRQAGGQPATLDAMPWMDGWMMHRIMNDAKPHSPPLIYI